MIVVGETAPYLKLPGRRDLAILTRRRKSRAPMAGTAGSETVDGQLKQEVGVQSRRTCSGCPALPDHYR